MTKFRVGRKDDFWTKPLGLNRAMLRVKALGLLHGGAKAIVLRDGSVVERPPAQSYRWFRWRLKTGVAGETPKLVFADGTRIAARVVEVEPEVELPAQADNGQTYWHPLLGEWYRFVFGTEWTRGRPTFDGAYNCRANRRDSSLWSMHSWWPPTLAIDFGVDSLALGDEIAAAIERKWPYPTAVVVWREPLHYSHIHVQVGHNREGRPGCAG